MGRRWTSSTGNVTGAGTLSPGSSPGLISFGGDLTRLGSSVLQMELAGTNAGAYDPISLAGALTAGGTLNVSLIESLFPQTGDVFKLLSYGSVAGGFSQINLPGNACNWDTGHLLAAPSDPLAGSIIFIPKPASAMLIAFGCTVLAARRRRDS